jgi:hypothetical protein
LQKLHASKNVFFCNGGLTGKTSTDAYISLVLNVLTDEYYLTSNCNIMWIVVFRAVTLCSLVTTIINIFSAIRTSDLDNTTYSTDNYISLTYNNAAKETIIVYYTGFW